MIDGYKLGKKIQELRTERQLTCRQLGALTADDAISAKQVGKITLFDKFSYVAIDHKIGKLAMNTLNNNNIKGRKFRVRIC